MAGRFIFRIGERTYYAPGGFGPANTGNGGCGCVFLALVPLFGLWMAVHAVVAVAAGDGGRGYGIAVLVIMVATAIAYLILQSGWVILIGGLACMLFFGNMTQAINHHHPTPAAGGQQSPTGAGLDNPPGGANVSPPVTAAPSNGDLVGHWVGTVSGTDAPVTVTFDIPAQQLTSGDSIGTLNADTCQYDTRIENASGSSVQVAVSDSSDPNNQNCIAGEVVLTATSSDSAIFRFTGGPTVDTGTVRRQ